MKSPDQKQHRNHNHRNSYQTGSSGFQEELRIADSNRATLDAFVRFAELHLMDIACAWQIAAPEQRQRVQNLLFHDGLEYSPESGILNRSNSCLFTVLEKLSDKEGWLASPRDLNPCYRRESPVATWNYNNLQGTGRSVKPCKTRLETCQSVPSV
jgi:hypothetical protein